MERVSCKYCKALFVPRKSKNNVQKFCKVACYFKHCRTEEPKKEVPVSAAVCTNKDEAIVFCMVYFLVILCTAFALFVYWTY